MEELRQRQWSLKNTRTRLLRDVIAATADMISKLFVVCEEDIGSVHTYYLLNHGNYGYTFSHYKLIVRDIVDKAWDENQIRLATTKEPTASEATEDST